MHEPRESVDHDPSETSRRVRLEVIELLASTDSVDLATLYRSLIGVIGGHAVPYIGEVVGCLVRENVIAVDTRPLSQDGPLIGWVRLLAVSPGAARMAAAA